MITVEYGDQRYMVRAAAIQENIPQKSTTIRKGSPINV